MAINIFAIMPFNAFAIGGEILESIMAIKAEHPDDWQGVSFDCAPLAAAGVHMTFAFGIISRLLRLFGLTDTGLFAIVTLSCFMLFGLLYTAVYLVTSGSYYKIVSSTNI